MMLTCASYSVVSAYSISLFYQLILSAYSISLFYQPILSYCMCYHTILPYDTIKDGAHLLLRRILALGVVEL